MVTLFLSSTFLMTDPPSPLIPFPFVCNNASQRITREISHSLSKFLNNPFYNSTVPLSFETYPDDIDTFPIIREHNDSYLYYIDNHSLVANPDEPPFSIPFTSPINNSDTFSKNIHPNNIYIPIAKVSTTFLNNLLEKKSFAKTCFQSILNPKSSSKRISF